MLVQYMYAEKLNYAVCGTTNKTELLLGQFVKYGDGGSDFEPLADCYKVQVYALGRLLNVNEDILKRPPSADTWNHFTTDEEFYWRMPLQILDQLLYAQEHQLPMEVIEKNTGLSSDTIEKTWRHINRIRDRTEYVRAVPRANGPTPARNHPGWSAGLCWRPGCRPRTARDRRSGR